MWVLEYKGSSEREIRCPSCVQLKPDRKVSNEYENRVKCEGFAATKCAQKGTVCILFASEVKETNETVNLTTIPWESSSAKVL